MRLALLLSLFLLPSGTRAADAQEVGVLLLAHGGDADWNKTVDGLAGEVAKTRKAAVAFGMADGDAMQAAVEKLEASGAKRIVAVPLFVSSHSSLYRQTAYLLGVSSTPSADFLASMKAMHEAMGHGETGLSMGSPDSIRRRVKAEVPVALSRALDDDPVVAQILTERARALSRDPAKESLVLVAHGPVETDDDAAWLADLDSLAKAVRKSLPFKATAVGTLRDDAPPSVRDEAVRRLRSKVREFSEDSTVLVVPVLVARGGIEGKLSKDLGGLDYRWGGQTLAPDPLLARWVEGRVRQALEEKP